MDPAQAALVALRREIKLLRAENTYLREQLFHAQLPRGQPAGAPTGSAPVSRLPSSHGMLAPGMQLGQLGGGGGGAVGMLRLGSSPSSGAAVGGGAPQSAEELMRRLLDTQRLLVQFSRWGPAAVDGVNSSNRSALHATCFQLVMLLTPLPPPLQGE